MVKLYLQGDIQHVFIWKEFSWSTNEIPLWLHKAWHMVIVWLLILRWFASALNPLTLLEKQLRAPVNVCFLWLCIFANVRLTISPLQKFKSAPQRNSEKLFHSTMAWTSFAAPTSFFVWAEIAIFSFRRFQMVAGGLNRIELFLVCQIQFYSLFHDMKKQILSIWFEI